MTHHTEVFEGGTIDIEDDTNLTINGKEISYIHDAVKNKWSSRYLPYTQYDSLLDLARAIIRDTVEFSGVKE